MNDLTTAAAPSFADTATTELTSIMTDQTHRLHAPFMRGDAEAKQYVDDLFRRAYPDDQTANHVTPVQPELTGEEVLAAGEIDAMLRATLGDRFDAEMADMRLGAQTIFSSPASVKALEEILAPAITHLGPQAELLAIHFLANLGRLTK